MSLFSGIRTAMLLATGTFAVSTLPLVTLGNEQIEVRLEGQTWFVGTLREAATPYLGAAALLSLGVGSTAFGLAALRSSQNRQQQVKTAIATLQQQLQQKEAQLQSMALSETRLSSTGLRGFVAQESQVSAIANAAPLPSPPPDSPPALPVALLSPFGQTAARRQSPEPPKHSADSRPTFLVQAGYADQPYRYPSAPVRQSVLGDRYQANHNVYTQSYGRTLGHQQSRVLCESCVPTEVTHRSTRSHTQNRTQILTQSLGHASTQSSPQSSTQRSTQSSVGTERPVTQALQVRVS